jgi:hypothetical protein
LTLLLIHFVNKTFYRKGTKMKCLNCYKVRLVLVVFLAVIVFSVGGVANADFTFGEPVNLGPTVNSSSGDAPSCFSSDGLELYISSDRPGGYGDWDIWVARRPTIEDDWGTPENLGLPVNTGQHEACACISGDGLSLFFHSERPGGLGATDLYVSTRETVNDNWGAPVNLGEPVNTSGQEHAPRLSTDGLELYFSCYNRPGGYGAADIWVTTRSTTEDDWGEPINLGSVVNSSADENFPVISANGLFFFFSEDYGGPYRPGGFGNIDMWVTTRASVNDPWETPLNLGSIVNSASVDAGAIISPDGYMLYFCSERPGGFGGTWGDIYQAPVIPIVNFNCDEIVDIDDLVILIEYWGTGERLCDIGPKPLGDGVVDEADLEVLMSYWGQEVHDPSLLAYWKLDETEGAIAYDITDGFDGAWHGDPFDQLNGLDDQKTPFDGIDDYVSTPFVLNPAETQFSISVWVNGGEPGQVIISQIDNMDLLSLEESNGSLVVEFIISGGRVLQRLLISDFIISDGLWHHVILTWDGTNRSLYVDGVLIAADIQTVLEDCDNGYYIGCGKNKEADSFFAGGISDVKIYNRAITP